MKRSVRLVALLLVLLLAIICILFALHYTSEYTAASVEEKSSVSGNYRPWDIWPVLLIDDAYYVWGLDAERMWGSSTPENLEYVADIVFVQEELPTEDYQLMSDFTISGKIYIDLDDSEDRYFLLVTTELLPARYISFVPLPDEELLVHYGLEFLIAAQS